MALLGPRQSGKTTLAREFVPEHSPNYFDLEDPAVEGSDHREMEEDAVIPDAVRDLLPATLSRLTAGLPMHELDIIIREAMACEDAL